MKKVGIVMGSDSDMPVAQKAIDRLDKYGIPYEVHIYSAHRTPEAARAFSANAAANGFGVIIALAGKAAHLAGSLAANTVIPVIGVPVKSSTLDGLDALLSTVQMPSGIPVATVAVDGAANAAILAVEILALSDDALSEKLEKMKSDMENGVAKKDAARDAMDRADKLMGIGSKPRLNLDRVTSPVELMKFKKKVKRIALHTSLAVICLGLESLGKYSSEDLHRIFLSADLTQAEIDAGAESYDELERRLLNQMVSIELDSEM